MNTIPNENQTPTETEKRIDNMPTATETKIPEAEYIKATDFTAETSTETLTAGNDNDFENEEDAFIVSFNEGDDEDDGTYEKVRVRATLKKYYDEGKANLQEWNTEIACHKLALESLQVSFTHESVHKAFRSIVFFASECKDNLDEAIDYFTEEKWKQAKSRGNEYRTPVALVLLASGASEESLIGNRTLCTYAKIAEVVHPQIKDGSITYENFIELVCKREGGIQGYYKNIGKNDNEGPDDDGPDDAGASATVDEDSDDGDTTKSTSQTYVVVFKVDETKKPNATTYIKKLQGMFKDEYQGFFPISEDALVLITEDSEEADGIESEKGGTE